MKKEKKKKMSNKWLVWLVLGSGIAIVAVLIIIAITISWAEIKSKVENKKTGKEFSAQARVAEIPYVSLHSFPDGIKQMTIPIGPERWEGITLPLGTTAYRIDPTVWHQIKPWNEKPGPIVKKEEAVHRKTPIKINSDLKAATFWVRGEKEATITIK